MRASTAGWHCNILQQQQQQKCRRRPAANSCTGACPRGHYQPGHIRLRWSDRERKIHGPMLPSKSMHDCCKFNVKLPLRQLPRVSPCPPAWRTCPAGREPDEQIAAKLQCRWDHALLSHPDGEVRSERAPCPVMGLAEVGGCEFAGRRACPAPLLASTIPMHGREMLSFCVGMHPDACSTQIFA